MGEALGAAFVPLLLLVTSVLLWPWPRDLTPRVGAAPSEWRARVRELAGREVRLPGRTGPTGSGDVADFAELAAVGLDAGLPAISAARLACEVSGSGDSARWREIDSAVTRAESGVGPLSAELRTVARADSDLTFLAAAWHLTDHFGVAAAPAARTAADVLRQRAAATERRTVLLAGPRASMWLLTLLPLTGPGVAMVLGLPVTEVYGEPVALGATAVGLLLTGLGWWWSRMLLHRAARAGEVQ